MIEVAEYFGLGSKKALFLGKMDKPAFLSPEHERRRRAKRVFDVLRQSPRIAAQSANGSSIYGPQAVDCYLVAGDCNPWAVAVYGGSNARRSLPA